MSYLIKERTWKIDRRIPLIFIMTFFLQITGVVIWAAQLDLRVVSLEKQTEPMQQASDKLGRIEERIEGLRKDNEQIKRQLEYIASKLMR